MSFPQQRWLYWHQLFDSMSSIFQEATRASVITCCTDVLWPLPRLELQIVHQCPHRKSSQWVRITLVGWDCKVNGDNVVSHSAKWLKRFRWRVSIDWVSHSPAMRPMTPDVLMTSPACMFSVAMIHLFRLPPATNAMSADLKTQMVKKYIYIYICEAFTKILTQRHHSGGWAYLQGSYRTSTTFSSKGLLPFPSS